MRKYQKLGKYRNFVLLSTDEPALSRMRHKFSEPLRLFTTGMYSYEELSEILVCPVGTLKSRLSRARQKVLSARGDGNANNPEPNIGSPTKAEPS